MSVVKLKISVKDPLQKLIKNPYSLGILKKDLDFKIHLVENRSKDPENQYIVFQKKYNNSAGYVAIFSVKTLSEETLKNLHSIYRELCGKYCNYNYKECEFVIIAERIETQAEKVIEEYNRNYLNRKPIEVVLNMLPESLF